MDTVIIPAILLFLLSAPRIFLFFLPLPSFLLADRVFLRFVVLSLSSLPFALVVIVYSIIVVVPIRVVLVAAIVLILVIGFVVVRFPVIILFRGVFIAGRRPRVLRRVCHRDSLSDHRDFGDLRSWLLLPVGVMRPSTVAGPREAIVPVARRRKAEAASL
jgi:hypothetical protein